MNDGDDRLSRWELVGIMVVWIIVILGFLASVSWLISRLVAMVVESLRIVSLP